MNHQPPAMATSGEVAAVFHTTEQALAQRRFRGQGPPFIKAGRPPGNSDQTRRRTRARALATLPSRAAVNPDRVRHTVGAEATAPSSGAW